VRRRSFDLDVIGGRNVENPVMNLLVVLGLSTLLIMLLLCWFLWDDRRRPKCYRHLEKDGEKRTLRQDIEQTSISSSAMALFAEVYSLTLTRYSRSSTREHSARLLLIDDRVGLLSFPGRLPCLIKRFVAENIRDQDDLTLP